MRSNGRLLAIFTLAVIAVTSVGLAVGVVAGRDFSRCVRSCNATRLACFDGCNADCGALYPGTPNKPARDACIFDCKNVCESVSDDCKLVCQAQKQTPPAPEVP
jgi:hypothetical protein